MESSRSPPQAAPSLVLCTLPRISNTTLFFETQTHRALIKTSFPSVADVFQVMALVMAPFLLDDPKVYDMFPGDAIDRARTYLVHIKGGIGAYSDSKGNPYIRQEVSRSRFYSG